MVNREQESSGQDGEEFENQLFESVQISENLVAQANLIQEHLISAFGKYIPETVIVQNTDIVDRVYMINDSRVVEALHEWKIAELEFEDGTIGEGFAENDKSSPALDINTGIVHILDRSEAVTDDKVKLDEDPYACTDEERVYFESLDMAYGIVLQYLDKALPTDFRISASAFYAELITQRMGIKPPIDEGLNKIHLLPAKWYAKNGLRYGEDMHKVAFGTFTGDHSRKRNIKRNAETASF